MTRYLAFDIETTKPFPEDHNWRSVRPMGIACAAAYGVGDEKPRAWYNRSPNGEIETALTRQQAQCQGRRQNIPVGRSKSVPPERSLASVNVRASCSGEVSQRQAGNRLGG